MFKNILRNSVFVTAALIVSTSGHCGLLEFLPNDSGFECAANISEKTYHGYCRNVYSPNGEDGILEKLFEELQIKNGTFCDVGALDGVSSSNVLHFIKNYGFSGIAIESDQGFYKKCLENYKEFSKVQVLHGEGMSYEKKSDLNGLLKKTDLPYDFDVLSLKIHCGGYYIWESFVDYEPKIVILETNSYRDPIFDELPKHPSTEYNIDPLKEWSPGRVAYGCSFISAVKLGLKKGYIPVAFTGNLIFVHKEFTHLLKEFPCQISDDPYDYVSLYTHLSFWDNRWYTNTGLILNAAIRDYYLEFGVKRIDPNWLQSRVAEILKSTRLKRYPRMRQKI